MIENLGIEKNSIPSNNSHQFLRGIVKTNGYYMPVGI
jgi:hypothetical protein